MFASPCSNESTSHTTASCLLRGMPCKTLPLPLRVAPSCPLPEGKQSGELSDFPKTTWPAGAGAGTERDLCTFTGVLGPWCCPLGSNCSPSHPWLWGNSELCKVWDGPQTTAMTPDACISLETNRASLGGFTETALEAPDSAFQSFYCLLSDQICSPRAER